MNQLTEDVFINISHGTVDDKYLLEKITINAALTEDEDDAGQVNSMSPETETTYLLMILSLMMSLLALCLV